MDYCKALFLSLLRTAEILSMRFNNRDRLSHLKPTSVDVRGFVDQSVMQHLEVERHVVRDQWNQSITRSARIKCGSSSEINSTAQNGTPTEHSERCRLRRLKCGRSQRPFPNVDGLHARCGPIPRLTILLANEAGKAGKKSLCDAAPSLIIRCAFYWRRRSHSVNNVSDR